MASEVALEPHSRPSVVSLPGWDGMLGDERDACGPRTWTLPAPLPNCYVVVFVFAMAFRAISAGRRALSAVQLSTPSKAGVHSRGRTANEVTPLTIPIPS